MPIVTAISDSVADKSRYLPAGITARLRARQRGSDEDRDRLTRSGAPDSRVFGGVSGIPGQGPETRCVALPGGRNSPNPPETGNSGSRGGIPPLRDTQRKSARSPGRRSRKGAATRSSGRRSPAALEVIAVSSEARQRPCGARSPAPFFRDREIPLHWTGSAARVRAARRRRKPRTRSNPRNPLPRRRFWRHRAGTGRDCGRIKGRSPGTARNSAAVARPGNGLRGGSVTAGLTPATH